MANSIKKCHQPSEDGIRAESTGTLHDFPSSVYTVVVWPMEFPLMYH